MPTDLSKIINLIDQIENRLSELSPETLRKVESGLGFVIWQMDESDIINAEIIA